MRKIIALGVMLLFLGMTISSSGFNLENQSVKPLSSGNILYVGGNGTGNYSKIQDAINDSSNGDTVFVYNGTYYENLIVDKTVYLIGEDRNSTIIDGNESGDVVYISTDMVNINGFTIQNSGNDLCDAGVQIISNMSKITGNVLIDCCEGIHIGPDDYMGWRTNYGNIITENIIENNKIGITIVVASEYNEVYENTIINNSCGIHVMPLDIPMKNSNNYQITMDYGYNNIYRNNVTNNNNGIYLFLTYHDNVYENEISQNGNGVVLEGWYSQGESNNVYHNNITENNRGIYMRSMMDGANKNNVYRNNIKQNNEGILIHCSGGCFCGGIRNNNIYQNNIMNNNKGICIEEQFLTYGARDNNIYQNNFIDNSEYHARDNCNNNWNDGSLGNYWDDWIGFGPKLIFGRRGKFGFIPRINFDWHPAKEPYDIGV